MDALVEVLTQISEEMRMIREDLDDLSMCVIDYENPEGQYRRAVRVGDVLPECKEIK